MVDNEIIDEIMNSLTVEFAAHINSFAYSLFSNE